MAHIFAISDIHGDADLLEARLLQLDEAYHIFSPDCEDTLVVCGDVIDGAPQSAEVVARLRGLQKQDGLNVVVLKGNHEAFLLDFLNGGTNTWISDPIALQTFHSFFPDMDREKFQNLPEKTQAEIARAEFLLEKQDFMDWLKKLPLYYETGKQIFVHAGVDEAAGNLWRQGTGEDTFLFKSVQNFGPFLKDVVAGHMNVRYVSGDPTFKGVFWDGASHFYLDGSGVKDMTLPVLIYDEEAGSYSQLMDDGDVCLLKMEVTGNS